MWLFEVDLSLFIYQQEKKYDQPNEDSIKKRNKNNTQKKNDNEQWNDAFLLVYCIILKIESLNVYIDTYKFKYMLWMTIAGLRAKYLSEWGWQQKFST